MLKRLLIGTILLSFLSFPLYSFASTQSNLNETALPNSYFTTPDISKFTERIYIGHLIAEYALQYQVSAKKMTSVISCESGFQPQAWNKNDPGNGSKGIAQFQESTFYGYAKELEIVDADIWNPKQQIQIMAYMFSKGKITAWTCASIMGIV